MACSACLQMKGGRVATPVLFPSPILLGTVLGAGSVLFAKSEKGQVIGLLGAAVVGIGGYLYNQVQTFRYINQIVAQGGVVGPDPV